MYYLYVVVLLIKIKEWQIFKSDLIFLARQSRDEET